MANISNPQYFPYRLLIFGPDGTLSLKAFGDKVSRDRAARELDDTTLALAVSVDYAVNGGDYPSGIDRNPERHVRKKKSRSLQTGRAKASPRPARVSSRGR